MNLHHIKRRILPVAVLTCASLLFGTNSFAAGPPVPAEISNGLAIVLLVVVAALLIVIGLLAYVLLGAAEISLQRFKAVNNSATKATLLLAGSLFTTTLFAADAPVEAAVAASSTIGGLSAFSYNMLLTIIGLELVVIFTMLYLVKKLLAREKVRVPALVKVATEPVWQKWWEKINSFKPLNEVSDTGHDYDGIRELDNKLPPWWVYGFIACIVFSIVYLYRYEVVHSAPSTRQEYEIAMAQADQQKEQYLKLAASKVDENSVTLVTDAGALAEGKKLFGASCAACHGADGQGVVGPNLTDEFWLHRGGVKDVFKIIKYGVPEKGMKSWKDDFSPVQIANLTGYIKSLQGSKPANPKEPQGEVFNESTASMDTSQNKIALR